MVELIKNNGSIEEFDSKKILKAIKSAMKLGSGLYNVRLAEVITKDAEDKFLKKEKVKASDVDKFVLNKLREYGQDVTAAAYEKYKMIKAYKNQSSVIDSDIDGVIRGTNVAVLDENANKRGEIIAVQRDLIAGVESRSYVERKLLPTHILNAHLNGLIHIHDTDYLIHPGDLNCCLINLEDQFSNGTVVQGNQIDTPRSLRTAATLATQISLGVASNQHGGQTFSIAHLAPYVRVSYEKWYRKYQDELSDKIDDKELKELAEKRTREEIVDCVQTIQYQELTFQSTNGQTPFVSIFMYLNEKPEYIKETAMLIEEMLKLRLKGIKNEHGIYVTPTFPKLLYVLDENNIKKDSEYRYLTDLAIKTTAKRMNPDYISAKMMRENYEGQVFPCMGCRSFLSPWKDENGNYKFYGRFNRGVVTINLVDAALSAKGDEDKFWKILKERLELCKEALLIKDSMLKIATSNVSPLHWQHGALGRLKPNEPILPLLRGGYSSISLGFIGIYEMTKAMKGVSHTNPIGKEFALRVIKYLEDTAISWREIEGLDGCSLYSTPAESLCYKFAEKTRNRFGSIPDITDKEWFTNSYHVSVTEEMDAFSKIAFESEFQKHSKGGAISYVEVPDMTNNLDALSEIIDFMYDHLIYGEINTRSGDHCAECGYEGELEYDQETDEWYCPECGCRDIKKLTICRRTCGYIGTTTWNKGKTLEIVNRKLHLH